MSETETPQHPVPRPRVAVVHDWMFSRRGGEKVLERILDLHPTADLFVLFGQPESVLKTKGIHRVHRSFLASLPKISKYYQQLLPLFPLATECHDLRSYDLIISSSSSAAKGVIPPPHAVHICYLHSPMRYAWDMQREYFPTPPRFSNPIALLRAFFLMLLRVWDVSSAKRVDVFCANSSFVQRRVQLYYGRDAEVIHPPVDSSRYLNLLQRRKRRQNTVLLFGAWTPYKKMHLALDKLLDRGFRVVSAGSGPLYQAAKKKHFPNPKAGFVDSPSDEEILQLFEEAHVLAYPGVEDFGIVPVEAMAAGVWVVAPSRGGTLETVVPGLTGFHFPAGDHDSMADAVQKALQQESPVESPELSDHLSRFSAANFDEKLRQTVENATRDRGSAS